MGHYYPNRGKAVSDFKAFYLSSCQVTMDLYLHGLCYFYLTDCALSGDDVRIANEIILVDLDRLPQADDLEARFVAIDYAAQIRSRLGQAARVTRRFGMAVSASTFHELESRFLDAVRHMVPLMATSNFIKTFIDKDDARFRNMLQDHDPETVNFLISQPAHTPFLRTLEMASLKYLAGRWSFGRFLSDAAFLRDMDPKDYFLSLEDLDRFVDDFRATHPAPAKAYARLLTKEQTRKQKVRGLRAQSLASTPHPEVLDLYFASIDIEEARHYWQARFSKEFCRCCLLVGASISEAGFEQMGVLLRGI